MAYMDSDASTVGGVYLYPYVYIYTHVHIHYIIYIICIYVYIYIHIYNFLYTYLFIYTREFTDVYFSKCLNVVGWAMIRGYDLGYASKV